MSAERAFDRLRRAISSPPRGLLSPTLLAPGCSGEQRVHRKLAARAFSGQTRVVALGMLVLSWLHWIAVGARRDLAQAIGRHGAAVEQHHGIDIATQRRRLRRLALLDSIAPSDAYDLELFLPARRAARWGYVYTSEVGAYHRWRSERHGGRLDKVTAQGGLLARKRATCDALAVQGIATPTEVERITKGSTYRDLRVGIEPVFLRPDVGNAARGAFRAQLVNGVLEIEPVIGWQPNDVNAYVDRFLSSGDLLVEELVRPHPDFVALGMPGDLAVVVRIITEGGAVVCAFAELPLRVEAERGTTNVFGALSVDLETGRLGDRVNPVWQRPSDAALSRGLRELFDAAAGLVVPFVAEAMSAVEQACAICPDIYGVAWDVAISPTGPVVLEGNTGWSVRRPQGLLGPMLRRDLVDNA